MAQRLNYQGRIVDANGVPVANSTYSIEFQIFDDVAAGSSVWGPETHGSVTLTNGLFSVELGDTVALSSINFNQDCWLQITVAGTAYSPRQRLTAVTYALTVPLLSITNGKLADSAVNSAKVQDNTLTAADFLVNVVSSVDGVTNDGGDIDLIGGTGITITPDDTANTITIAPNLGSIDHNSLMNLTTGDPHTQYFNLSQSETVSGIPAFNGGTTGSSAPFTVDSTYVVSSLNADYLDGQHGSYYQNADNINAGTLGTGYYSAYADLSAETKIGTGAAQVAAGNHSHTNMVTGTGTATRVAFWDTASTISSNANLYWDNTNSRLGIGTTSPSVGLHVSGNAFFDLPAGTANER
ncbi:MAG: hypothetical protein WCX65_14220, partial [bacterium]